MFILAFAWQVVSVYCVAVSSVKAAEGAVIIAKDAVGLVQGKKNMADRW